MSETPRLFDIPAAVEYVRSLGANGVTAYTIRTAINSGRLAKAQLGKKFYVTKEALDSWISQAERRARA